MKQWFWNSVLWLIILALAVTKIQADRFEECIGYFACNQEAQTRDFTSRGNLMVCYDKYGKRGQQQILKFSRKFFNNDTLSSLDDVLDAGCADKEAGAKAIDQFFEERKRDHSQQTRKEHADERDFNRCIADLQERCKSLDSAGIAKIFSS